MTAPRFSARDARERRAFADWTKAELDKHLRSEYEKVVAEHAAV